MERLLLLLSVLGLAHTYPNGAPPGICTLNPEPKHGFNKPQTSPSPYEITMSKDHVTSLEDTIKVRIKAGPGVPKFRGFLIMATDDARTYIGTWENDDWSHPLSCGATTHDKKVEKDDITLTWKPLVQVPNGKVHMKAVIVQKFDTFWINIPVPVSGASSIPSSVQKPSQATEAPPKALSTTPKSNSPPPKGGVPLPGLVPASTPVSTVSSTPGKEITPTTTTSLPTTTKRRSLINRLLGGGSKSTTKTTTPKPTTTTPKPTTTTPKPTTTSKKPGFFSGLFGGNSRKSSTTPSPKISTTPQATTISTTKAPAAQSQQAVAGNEGSIKLPSKEVELISTTTPSPSTTKGSAIRRIFG